MTIKIEKSGSKGNEKFYAHVALFNENTAEITRSRVVSDSIPKLTIKLQEIIYEHFKTN